MTPASTGASEMSQVETLPGSPSFSVVIPTYNESQDIDATLVAVLEQEGFVPEVIVVDDGSTDDTVAVVGRRAGEQLKLLRQPHNRGVSAARNAGIAHASRDVVVILNADVTLPPDFLSRLAAHYRAGADCVSVESWAENQESLVARFVQADHEARFGPTRREAVGWTEGFSCRRELAQRARFPEELPGCGGEDGEFVRRLLADHPRWVRDFTIVVPHRAPADLGGFWRQWRGRGFPVPFIDARLRRRPLGVVVARRLAAFARTLIVAVLLIPMIWAAAIRAGRSARPIREFCGFWALLHVQALASHVGAARGLVALLRDGRA